MIDAADDPAAPARALLRERRSAALATLLPGDGGPFASLVTVAGDVDGSPVLLLSTLSDHTRALAADPRAALLFEDAVHLPNPQTGPRLTVIGWIAPDEAPRLRRRFLARHPEAELYAGFTDFRIFRMTVERGHFVGGFAQAHRLKAADLLSAPDAAAALADAEPDVLEHMNRDHGEAIDLYANRLLGRPGSGWRMIAVDPEGCDLALGGGVFARLPFPRPVAEPAGMREVLTELARRAREA